MVKYGSLQGLKGHIYNQKQQLGVGWTTAGVAVGGCSQTYLATSIRRRGGLGGVQDMATLRQQSSDFGFNPHA